MSDGLDLLPGERLLWSGSPQRRPLFERSDWVALFLVYLAYLLFGRFVVRYIRLALLQPPIVVAKDDYVSH